MVTVILATSALVVAVIALVISVKKSNVKVIKETNTVVEHAPTEHPFVYDEENNSYRLDGNLFVSGGISCLTTKSE